MSKKITVNEKLISKIDNIISVRLELSHLPEFQDYSFPIGNYKLFDDRPENWSELEIAIHEYTMRIRKEIFDDIVILLKEGNSR